MSRHVPRFHVQQPLTAGGAVLLDSTVAHHLVRVLRARTGDPLILFDGSGGEWQAEITEIIRHKSGDQVHAELKAHIGAQRESPLRITLAQLLLRADRMDYCLQKATELGVAVIQPLWADNQKIPNESQLQRKSQHWQAVIQSAAEQSGRTALPLLESPQRLSTWQPVDAASARLLLAPEGGLTLQQCLPATSLTLLIGAESGLDDVSLQQARSAGFQALRLGPRTLRAETAGPAAIAAIQCLWGDLG